MSEMETWDSEAFEEAAELVARRLASFRLGLDADDPYAFNEDEKLKAGIIVGTIIVKFELVRVKS